MLASRLQEQTEGLLYGVVDFVFECQWPSQPACIPAYRPLTKSGLSALKANL